MNSKLLTILLILAPLFSFADKDAVKSEVEDSFDYAKEAWSLAEDALSYIKKSYNSDHIDDMQYYAGKAKREIDDAMSKAGEAEEEADDAESEASYISCYDAESNADDAEDEFSSAKSYFDDAYSKIKYASYEDDPEQLYYYLKKAKSYIEDAMTNLKNGVDELNDTLEALSYCD